MDLDISQYKITLFHLCLIFKSQIAFYLLPCAPVLSYYIDIILMLYIEST